MKSRVAKVWSCRNFFWQLREFNIKVFFWTNSDRHASHIQPAKTQRGQKTKPSALLWCFAFSFQCPWHLFHQLVQYTITANTTYWWSFGITAILKSIQTSSSRNPSIPTLFPFVIIISSWFDDESSLIRNAFQPFSSTWANCACRPRFWKYQHCAKWQPIWRCDPWHTPRIWFFWRWFTVATFHGCVLASRT